MTHRTRRNRRALFLETFEDRTMLSGVGVNLYPNYQFSGEAVWTDVSRLLGPWVSVDRTNWWTPNPAVVTNSLDSPLIDAAAVAVLSDYPNGVYELSFKGTVALDFWGVGHLVGPLVKGADGVTRGEVLVDGDVTQTAGSRNLIMDVTNIDPNDPLANLDILAPGYPADGSQMFTNEFLKQLQPFDDIRFMNWELTNNSPMVSWSDRAQPNQILSTSSAGQSIEYEAMIELGNQTHKDIWLNVPALADDGFVKNLADMVRDELDPSLKVYIEYSNETWNSSFTQRSQVLAAANTNPLVTATNDVAKVAQQTAFKTKEISDVFHQEFGAGFDRVIPVLAGWTVFPTVIQTGLQFIQQNYGDPTQYVKSTAIAPYIGLMGGTDTANQTIDGLFASMNQYLDFLTPYIQQNAQVAAAYGLPLDSYEGGQAIFGNVNSARKNAAQDDPRMYTLYQRYLNVWESSGGNLMNLFTLFGPFWGLKPQVNDPGSQKFDSVVSRLVPAGDATLDGKVDFADFQVLAANFDQSGEWWMQGDFNHDSKVDHSDLELFLAALAPGALTADQAAQIALFDQPSTSPSDRVLEFNLFARVYAGDLGFQTVSGGPVGVDRVYNGAAAGAGLLMLNGTNYDKGLGASSNSRINVSLAGAYTSFDAMIGVDDRAGAGNGGSVFQVVGDGQVLYTSPVMSAGASAIPIEVSVKGVSTLSLVVTTTEGASPSIPADWALARLVVSPSTPSVPATKLAWTLTKDGAPFTTSAADSFVFRPSGAGQYVVSVQATDSGGGQATRSVTVNVTGQSAPTVATYVATDSTTKGTWKGTYGDAGYVIPNIAANPPSYATVEAVGSLFTWAGSTTDARALQRPSTSANLRSATCWYGSSFTIDVNVTDGVAHTISLYALDWDNRGRSERIDVVDATTGEVIDSRTISSFQNGVYLTWNATGHVQFRVTKLAGPNAVMSGLFFQGGAQPTFGGRDDVTQGAWKGKYGSLGYSIPNGGAQTPTFATASATGSRFTWNGNTMDPRALRNPAYTTSGLATCWYGSRFSINVNLTDGGRHKVSLYALDWDNRGRSERIDVINTDTGEVIDSQTLSSYQGGVYLSWNLSGKITFQITSLAGPNAVVSGLFFD